MFPEVAKLDVGALRAALRAPPSHKERFAYLCEVALALGELSGSSELLALWPECAADADAARAIVFGAASVGRDHDAVTRFLRERLDDDRPLIVAEAIDGLSFRNVNADSATVAGWLSAPAPEIRGAGLRFLAKTTSSRVLERLVAALGDPSYLVRENAVDELDGLRAVSTLPAIRRLIHDPHPHVREAAKNAVARLESARAS